MTQPSKARQKWTKQHKNATLSGPSTQKAPSKIVSNIKFTRTEFYFIT